MAAIRRSLSSCLEATRIWRRTDRASVEKKPSARLSQEPCLGVKVNSKRPAGRSASQARVSLEMCAEIVENQVDRRVGRVSRVEHLEKLDELAAAVAIPDQSMDVPGQQIDAGQQSDGAMALVFMIAGKRRMHAGLGRQVGGRGCESRDAGLLVIGDDGHRILGRGLLHYPHLAVDAQRRWDTV